MFRRLLIRGLFSLLLTGFSLATTPVLAESPDALCGVRFEHWRALVAVPGESQRYYLASTTFFNGTDVACDIDYKVRSVALTDVQPFHPAIACVQTDPEPNWGVRCTGQVQPGDQANVQFFTRLDDVKRLGGQAQVTDQVGTRPAITWTIWFAEVLLPAVRQ